MLRFNPHDKRSNETSALLKDLARAYAYPDIPHFSSLDNKMASDDSPAYGILTKQLADLLGFDDGASDVLEHLLSIESRAVR
jgi:hypothetical protein